MRAFSFHIRFNVLALFVIAFAAFGSHIVAEDEHSLDTSAEGNETGIIKELAWDVMARMASAVGSKATDFAEEMIPQDDTFPMMNRALGITTEHEVEIRPCGTDPKAAKEGCSKCIAFFTTQSRPRENGKTKADLEDRLVCAVPSAYGILGPGDFSRYGRQDWYESCCRERSPSADVFKSLRHLHHDQRKPVLRIDWGRAPYGVKAWKENMWFTAPYWSVFVNSGVEVNGNPVYTTVDGRVNIFVKKTNEIGGPDKINWGIAWSSQAEESFSADRVGEFAEGMDDRRLILSGVRKGSRALDREIHLGAWHNLNFDDYQEYPSASKKQQYSRDMANYVQGMINPPTGLQSGAGVWYARWTGKMDIMRCSGTITLL